MNQKQERDTMHVTIQPVDINDPAHRGQWYIVRKEPSVRHGWRDLRKITPAAHKCWWDEQAECTTRQLYMIYKDSFIAGILRLDDRKTWTELWIAIKPEYRKEGIASLALALIIRKASQQHLAPLGVILHNKSNTASWRLFTRAGFVVTRKGCTKLTIGTR